MSNIAIQRLTACSHNAPLLDLAIYSMCKADIHTAQMPRLQLGCFMPLIMNGFTPSDGPQQDILCCAKDCTSGQSAIYRLLMATKAANIV